MYIESLSDALSSRLTEIKNALAARANATVDTRTLYIDTYFYVMTSTISSPHDSA